MNLSQIGASRDSIGNQIQSSRNGLSKVPPGTQPKLKQGNGTFSPNNNSLNCHGLKQRINFKLSGDQPKGHNFTHFPEIVMENQLKLPMSPQQQLLQTQQLQNFEKHKIKMINFGSTDKKSSIFKNQQPTMHSNSSEISPAKRYEKWDGKEYSMTSRQLQKQPLNNINYHGMILSPRMAGENKSHFNSQVYSKEKSRMRSTQYSNNIVKLDQNTGTPRSSLSNLKQTQNFKLNRLHKNFANSIRVVEQTSKGILQNGVVLSPDIQRLVFQKQNMGQNIQQSMISKSQRDQRILKLQDISQRQKNLNRNQGLNDYDSYLRDNIDSISALNTIEKQQNNEMQKSNVTKQRLRASLDAAHSSNQQTTDRDESKDPLTQDSIMSHEYELLKEEDNSFIKQENLINSTRLNSFIDLCGDSKNNQVIVDQMIEAQSSIALDGPKVERLIQMDFVINNINNRFKSKILNKFTDDQTNRDRQRESKSFYYHKKLLGESVSKRYYLNKQTIEKNRGKSNMNQTQSNIMETTINLQNKKKSSKLLTEESLINISSPLGQTKLSKKKLSKVNSLMRNLDSNDNLKTGEDIIKKDNFKDLDELIRMQEQQQDSRLPAKLRALTLNTCDNIDQIILQKKEKVKTTAQLVRTLIDGDVERELKEEDQQFLQNPFTSSLEKKRRRIVNDFQQEIKKRLNMLQEIETYVEQQKDPDLKASQILQNLKNSSRGKDGFGCDPEVMQALEQIEPETARFVANLIDDVMSQTQKNKLLRDLSLQIQKLIAQKEAFNAKMKTKIQQKRTQENVQQILMHGLKELNKQAKAFKLKEDKQGHNQKFQFVTDSNNGEQKKPRKFQMAVKKHYHKIVETKFQLGFMTKIVNMIQQFENIFQDMNIGEFYLNDRHQLWENEYLRKIDQKSRHMEKQKINNLNNLYTTEVEKMKYYNDLKMGEPHDIDQNATEKIANLQFMMNLEKSYQMCLPTFARQDKNELFLSELRFTDQMATGLSEYLDAVKPYTDRLIKGLYIYNCNMTDKQLSAILQGILNQGKNLKTFAYSNGEFNSLSADVFEQFIKTLNDIHITSLQKSYSYPILKRVVEQIFEKGLRLQKLKLSNINLCDNEIVQNLCYLVDEREYIQHFDVSWAKLSPKHLNAIMLTLAEKHDHKLKYLNVSYNSLVQPPFDDSINYDPEKSELKDSQEFVHNLCEFIINNKLLNHLDISGMNFSNDQLLQVADIALCQSENLLAIHLSDNGIRFNQEIRDEILDIMGLSKSIYKVLDDDDFKINQRIMHPEIFKNIIRKQTMSLKTEDIQNSAKVDANIYTNRLLHTKQGKLVINKMNQHKVQMGAGFGRLESNLVDQFVLSRWVNQPELVFNQQPYIDAIFQMDAGYDWRVVDTECGIHGGCPICNKHKYTMIFYEQDLENPWSLNEDLIEIKDSETVNKIKQEFNISYRYSNEIAPLITGTVVTGGFKRKLRMVRADYFSLLSVSQSIRTVNSNTQIKAIKRGLLANLTKTQDLQKDDKHLPFLKGWHKRLIIDKCLRNEVQDVQVVNFPSKLNVLDQWQSDQDKNQEGDKPKQVKSPEQYMPEDKDCTIYIYTAILPPGQHQFLLYDPKTHRAFCKDLIVDLNECEQYPEFPKKYMPPVPPKKLTRQNVWRQWRIDNEEDITLCYNFDIQRIDGTHFIRKEQEQLLCDNIMRSNFAMLQIVWLELIAKSKIYPRMPYDVLVQSIIDQQKTAEERNSLQRSQIELAFMGATRLDNVKGLSGILNRGQFFEIVMRLVQQRYSKGYISENLKGFIELYIKPIYDSSMIIPIRNQLRESKELNQLLFDNRKGLTEIFNSYEDPLKGFTFQSAISLLNPLDDNLKEAEFFVPDMQKIFYHSKMTNLKDKDDRQFYFSLVYVEFLEFICRIAIDFWQILQRPQKGMESIVFELLGRIWDFINTKPSKIDLTQTKKGDQGFPELVNVTEIDSDDEAQ